MNPGIKKEFNILAAEMDKRSDTWRYEPKIKKKITKAAKMSHKSKLKNSKAKKAEK